MTDLCGSAGKILKGDMSSHNVTEVAHRGHAIGQNFGKTKLYTYEEALR